MKRRSRMSWKSPLSPVIQKNMSEKVASVGFELGPFGCKLNRLLVVVEGWNQF